MVLKESLANNGIFIWPCSLVLSAYLASISSTCKDRNFYEIGAGCSLPSLVAAKLGAAKCCLTDKFDEIQLEILNCNIQMNNIEHICHAQSLNWGEMIASNDKYDFLLGSDIFYSSENFDDIITTLWSMLLKNPHAVFLTTYHQRRYILINKSFLSTFHYI